LDNTVKNIILFIIILFLQTNLTIAQKNLNEGNKYYDRNLFEEAIPYYLKEIDKGTYKTKREAMSQLANCYRLTGRFLEANEIYKKILEKSSYYNKSEHILNYANSLKSSALYEEAAEQFKKYISLEPDDPMGKIYLKSCAMAQDWLNEEEHYFVMNFEQINTEESDFAPCYYDEGIVFTSSREGSMKKFINFSGNSDELKTDLYYANLLGRTEENITIRNIDQLNSFEHDGSATFSSDGKEIYFTRTVMGTKNRKKNLVLNSLQVFYSKKNNDSWSEPKSAFSFNSVNYSVGQPSLSADGKKIYYVSDMPGGLGETDIYYSELQKNGKWGPPINIGEPVNTFGHELTPFIYGNDTLFFSSDTHPGMGKLDIFYSVKKDGKWGEIKNMKPPINSIGNDFSLILDPSHNKGFFSSDRFNGNGKEDIYSLYHDEPFKINLIGNKIQFRDYNIYNGLSYKISIEGSNDSKQLIAKKGIVSFKLQEDSVYRISLRKNGFFYDAIMLKITRENSDEIYSAEIKSRNTQILVGGVLANTQDSIITQKTYDPKKAKKEPVVSTDTICVNIPVSNTNIILEEDNHIINQVVTDTFGNYSFSNILETGKLYRLYAFKEEESPINITEDLTSLKDTLETPPENTDTLSVIPVQPDSILAEQAIDTTKIVITKNEPIIETDTLITNPINNEPEGDTLELNTTKEEPETEKIIEEPKPVEKNLSLSGKILDDNNRVSNVKIKVYSIDNILLLEKLSDNDGIFELSLPYKESYSISLIKNGYFEKQISLTKDDPHFKGNPLTIKLSPIVKNTTIELKNIIFDLNKSVLRKESYSELNRLTDFLKANPSLNIQLDAYTDTRGDYYFNLKLSQKRAEAVKSYLLSKGIDESRIITMGYGESFPIIPNANTEAEHRVNRRVEFKVLDHDAEQNWNFTTSVPVHPEGFYVFNKNAYSANKPFEKNSPLPDGLIYRIKIGVYSKELKYDHFKGLFPIVQETNSEKHKYEYFVGLFYSLEDAEIALEIIKKNFCNDAYILAYYNKKHITIKEALKNERKLDRKNPAKR